ncbi:hypothetical protein D3C75_876130 [compost metagenome]
MDLNVSLPGNDGRNAVVEALWVGICRNNGRRPIIGAPWVGFVQKQWQKCHSWSPVVASQVEKGNLNSSEINNREV